MLNGYNKTNIFSIHPRGSSTIHTLNMQAAGFYENTLS